MISEPVEGGGHDFLTVERLPCNLARSECGFSGPLPDDENSLSLDPKLADPDNGNLRPLPGSPAIDSGSSDVFASVDIDGVQRRADPVEGGVVVFPAARPGQVQFRHQQAGELSGGFCADGDRQFVRRICGDRIFLSSTVMVVDIRFPMRGD